MTTATTKTRASRIKAGMTYTDERGDRWTIANARIDYVCRDVTIWMTCRRTGQASLRTFAMGRMVDAS